MTRRTALITGASSGIGKELAWVYASHGYDVVIVARRAERLAGIARDLEAEHGIRVTAVTADLSDATAPERIHEQLASAGTNIDVLVNNAAAAERATFTERTWPDHIGRMNLLTVNPTRLIHLLLPGMLDRGHGRVLNILSLGTYFAGSPYTALYSPSKAFMHKLTEGLTIEYRDSGVSFTSVIPGMVETELIDSMGVGAAVRRAPKFVVSSPRSVAEYAYEASTAGKVISTHGLFNRMFAAILRHYPARNAHKLMDWDRGFLKIMGLSSIDSDAKPTDTVTERG